MHAPPIPDRACALLLDLDGSLIELAPSPEQIHVPDALLALLHTLHQQLHGALACISGRSYDNLGAWLGCAGIDLVGSHGAEIGSALAPDVRWAEWAAQCMQNLQTRFPPLLVEVKPHGMAIHWRNCPQAEKLVRWWVNQHLSAFPEHHATAGKCVVELHASHCNKGDAVTQLMRDKKYVQRLAIYIGDDTTDLAAFAAVKALGGWAIAVGPKTASAADFVLPHPAACQQWLLQLSKSLSTSVH